VEIDGIRQETSYIRWGECAELQVTMVMCYVQTEEAKGGYLQGDDVRGHVGQQSCVGARWSEIVVVEMVEKW
jgi:hypothetical protein